MSSFIPAKAQLAPDLKIPSSNRTVRVSVIDSTARIGGLKTSMFFEPQVGEHATLRGPAFSFLIEHEAKGERVLFDLGLQKDWEQMPKHMVERIESMNAVLEVEKDVAEILPEHGVALESISAVIYSHWHWDHVGNLALFPSSTELVVGPGFKERFVPGYPVNPESPINDSNFTGREIREVRPDADAPALGGFQALDYFGDGSFYLLFSPGHTADHMCGLARTTAEPETYIFMAGDAVHHSGEHRPSQYVPLPDQVSPDPREDLARAWASACPGELLYAMHPRKSGTKPFYEPAHAEDLDECKRSIGKLIGFDGHENVLCIMAHDQPMLDVLEFFPSSANDWKAKGWREKGFWAFTRQFMDSKA